MTNDLYLTIVGNLTGAPELRFTSSGAAVVNFSIAQTPKIYDKATGSQKDVDTIFMRTSAWRDMAENIAESLDKGTRVVAYGRITSRSWEANGEKRTVLEMELEAIGPDLRFATAKVTRKGQSTAAAASHGYTPATASNDPWANVPDANTPPF